MRMINTMSGEEAWLHQDTTMFQVQELQAKSGEVNGEWKFELRIRYLPLEWSEVYEADNLTFMSYYNQILTDYLSKNFESLDQEIAFNLGCLEIRRLFKDMLQNALEKKSNIEYLEKEVGLSKFLPKIILDSVKPKTIRKLIQQHFKKYAHFTERDCMFKFLDLLKGLYRYDQERFRCTTGSWSIPVTLVIGPSQGISYTTDSTATATHMTEFSHIQSIQTLESGVNAKGLLQLRVAGSAELLTVTCPTLREAENIADLVDGYCRQVNNSPTSIWIRKG